MLTRKRGSPDNTDELREVARTTLSSKIVTRCLDQMAKIAVDAILAVADLERKDVNLDLIKMEGKVGGQVLALACLPGAPCKRALLASSLWNESN